MVNASFKRTVCPGASVSAGREHVDGAVLEHAQQDAVSARRLAETVDLLAQRDELLPGLLESVEQLRVAQRQGIDPALELAYLLGGLPQLAP
jgi:hypothetical protein